MKHYIVTFEGRLWLVYAQNPPEAIKQVMGQGVKGKWNDFKAMSVGSITNLKGKCVEFKVVDAE